MIFHWFFFNCSCLLLPPTGLHIIRWLRPSFPSTLVSESLIVLRTQQALTECSWQHVYVSISLTRALPLEKRKRNILGSGQHEPQLITELLLMWDYWEIVIWSLAHLLGCLPLLWLLCVLSSKFPLVFFFNQYILSHSNVYPHVLPK